MQTLENPFWITSKVIEYGKYPGKTVAVFDFPKGTYKIIDAGVEIITALTGGTPSVAVGAMTVPVEAFVDGATFTYSATDGYVASADVTEGTPAYYPSAVAAYAGGAGSIVVGAATTMPIVAVTHAASGTGGLYRVHMLITRVPVQSA
jgi:hypothetical protein